LRLKFHRFEVVYKKMSILSQCLPCEILKFRTFKQPDLTVKYFLGKTFTNKGSGYIG
jgi:hypothetical protein